MVCHMNWNVPCRPCSKQHTEHFRSKINISILGDLKNHREKGHIHLDSSIHLIFTFQLSIYWNHPPRSNSRHQDYSIFSRESLQKIICDWVWSRPNPWIIDRFYWRWIFALARFFVVNWKLLQGSLTSGLEDSPRLYIPNNPGDWYILPTWKP